jgi:hypothetical protein
VTWGALVAAALPVVFSGGDPARYTRVPAPGVRYRMNMATATSAPWIDSNLWRYRRAPERSYLVDAREKQLPLILAEAHAAGAALAVEIAPAQKKEFDSMLAFLRPLPDGPTGEWANVTISEDGSAQAAEALSLLTRRNLLYRILKSNDTVKADFRLTSAITNPYEFMLQIREKVGDERRLLRLFGSELTLARLTRDGNRVRLRLVNYGSRPVESLRVRLHGRYRPENIRAYVYENPAAKIFDQIEDGGYTEFSLDRLPVYGVVDLVQGARTR